MQADNYLTYSK